MTIQSIMAEECTGCGACENICPVGCISLQMDAEGFRYPIVDESRCINCGKCLKTCRSRKRAGSAESKSIKAYAAYTKDAELLRYSSSGGIFAVLAQEFIHRGGIVYGAGLDGLKVKHMRIHNKEKLMLIQKSKYLQSNISNTYQQAREDLESGLEVLFSGTPCQIAGLYAFLGQEYKNLTTCDVVCHGVPSEKVFEKFVQHEEKVFHSKLVGLFWRDKRNGWHKNSIVEVFEDGQEIATQSYYHSFQRGFLDNLYLRPSCYQCQFCGVQRVADISLADYWQAEKHNKEFAAINDDRGISIVIASSLKGILLFEKVKSLCIWKEIDISVVKECSRHFYLPPLENKDRNDFFQALPKSSYKKICKKFIFGNVKKEKLTLRCKIFLKTRLEKLMH